MILFCFIGNYLGSGFVLSYDRALALQRSPISKNEVPISYFESLSLSQAFMIKGGQLYSSKGIYVSIVRTYRQMGFTVSFLIELEVSEFIKENVKKGSDAPSSSRGIKLWAEISQIYILSCLLLFLSIFIISFRNLVKLDAIGRSCQAILRANFRYPASSNLQSTIDKSGFIFIHLSYKIGFLGWSEASCLVQQIFRFL